MPDETLAEVRAILEHDKKVPQSVVNRLTLALLADQSEKSTVILTAQAEQEKRIQKLEETSIIMWGEAHPKLALFLVSIAVIIGAVFQEYGPALAKAIGLP